MRPADSSSRHRSAAWRSGAAALALALVITGCRFGAAPNDPTGTSGPVSTPTPPTTPTATYAIGGSVSGVTGTLTLQDNGGDNLALTNDGSFTFATALASGAQYHVTVASQPTGQTCLITGGSGTVASAAVTTVMVSCSTTSAFAGQWTWVGGANSINGSGRYGAEGVAAAGNTPGARANPASWIDAQGNLWLFGGWGFDARGFGGVLNDLWEYNPGSHQWSWVEGSMNFGAAGVYGTQGMAAATGMPANMPGARSGASTWIDAQGNLWLFGGVGADANQNPVEFNDLWEYTPSSGQWIWQSGADTTGSAGSYGTLGLAAAGDAPAARGNGATWIDAQGNLWLFGGAQYSASGAPALNDLWSYSPTSGEWTWVAGSSAVGTAGVYGTLGVAAASNLPGARASAVTWLVNGTLWLFGGNGNDGSGKAGALNDLWTRDSTSGQWTWVGGSSTQGAMGVYGTAESASATNAPGARASAVGWADASGNLWLFGGKGFDSAGTQGNLNDLWSYSLASGQWTWVSGSEIVNAGAVYGTQGSGSTDNVPGARELAVGWWNGSGSLWLFGGFGNANGTGELNDLWTFTP